LRLGSILRCVQVLVRGDQGIYSDPGVGGEPPAFGPTVSAHEVGGDAEQPRTGVLSTAVVAGAAAERDDEGLRGKVLRQIEPDPPIQVPVDRYEMPLEDRAEQPGIIVRRGDDLGVRRDPQRFSSLPWYFPKSLDEFSLTQEGQERNNSRRARSC